MSENQKLREALQAISHIDDTTNHSVDASAALDRIGQIARQALAMPTADHLPEAGKMINGLTKAETDASASVSGLTAAPVCEREAFEREMSKPPFEFCMDRWPDDGSYSWPGNYAAYHTQCAWAAWQARAALSAGDAVLAEREACAKLCEEVADDLITAMRGEGETDDEVLTRLVASARVCAKEIRGGYSKKFNPHNAAIDAAMQKDKL
jgi:hypothetical protein